MRVQELRSTVASVVAPLQVCVNLLPGRQCWVSDSRTVVTGRSGLAKKPPAAKGSFCPRYLAKLPSPRPQPASRLLPVQVLGSGRRRLPTL